MTFIVLSYKPNIVNLFLYRTKTAFHFAFIDVRENKPSQTHIGDPFMIALQLTPIKEIMNQLLIKDSFDIFLLREATLQMGISYVIDGSYNKDFFTEEELNEQPKLYDLISWSEVKSTMLNLIKGKKTPLAFQITFYLSNTQLSSILADELSNHDIKALGINLKYENNRLLLTSAINYSTFTLDKSIEPLLEDYIINFLKSHSIDFESLL